MVNKKLKIWLPLIFSIVLIIGMFLGYILKGGNAKGFFSVEKPTPYEEALQIIKMKYVDSVNIDSLKGKSIEAIMDELDPHSVYLPPVELKIANDDLEGKFEGIGVEFNLYNDTVQVVYVIPGGPGEKAGMMAGDIVLKANDSIISGKKLDATGIKEAIRGKSGSVVQLQLLRAGKPITLSITRGAIAIPSVDAYFMLDSSAAYLKLSKFTETSYEEFMYAMEALKKKGMQQLVLDLRHNGGGLMDEAVDIADEFLDGEKLIVYTQGVNSKKKEYKCKRPGILEKGKLTVLVDELTASASEVLCGALQDWCRATIIGQRSFGKGLVMEQFPLSDGSAIRLTTARYYTPIGRCIQRSYENGKKVYMDEIWQRYASGEMSFTGNHLMAHGKPFLTVCKDTVYESEGIVPNVFVPVDTNLNNEEINKLLYGSSLSQFAFQYYLKHQQEIMKYSTVKELLSKTDAGSLFQEFNAHIKPTKPVTENIKNRIIQQIFALLARYKWGNAGYTEALIINDKEVNESLAMMNK